MSYITAIATANPPHRIAQSQITDFMVKTMSLKNGDARKLKAIFGASGIDYRHSVLSDYGRSEHFEFYPNNSSDKLPGTGNRLDVFRKHALPLSKEAARRVFDRHSVQPADITHLIVVSCTGMYAPGLDIDLVDALGLSRSVQRTAINFMGCYAAFNALKIADAFCRADVHAKVLIITTELCSLHFQRESTDDNLLANALFADGSAALIVEGKSASPLQLELSGFYNEISSTGAEDMAWSIGDLGFEMKLSSYVPSIIQSGIRQLTSALLSRMGKNFEDIRHFAIHPGGKKILEVIEKELGITAEQNQDAYKVLRNYGNMSSPTVLFVLRELLNRLSSKNKGENILSFAFGPGLTMESMLLQIKSI